MSPRVRAEYHPFPLADDGGDLGMTVPLRWKLAETMTRDVKAAALSLYEKDEYGPPSRERIVFRASELGNILSVRDAKGEPSGCARKPWYRYHADRFPPRRRSAEEVLNFAKGNEEEAKMRDYLTEAGILLETQLKLGAWAAHDDEHAPEYVRGDPRYPDRSGGLARGKADFIIDARKYARTAARIPLEFKSSSSYAYRYLHTEGPKPEHALQGAFYAHEMNADHFAVGYVDKESGDILIFVCRTPSARFFDRMFERLMWMRDAIEDGELPPAPMGTHAPMSADPPGSRYAGKARMPDDPFFDRAWPCYVWGSKKGRAVACEWFAHCHGRLPDEPEGGAEVAIKRARARRAKERPAKRGGKTLTFSGRRKR